MSPRGASPDLRPGGAGPPELLELLGGGGIGETWVAHGGDGQLVATKRILCPDTSARNQLLGRGRILAELRAPELSPVSGLECRGEEVWVSSALCQGLTLRRLLRVATLTPGQAVAVGSSLLLGLAALHRAGLWHGSVHAGNVYVEASGAVRLGDGGLVPLVKRRGRVREARCRRADVAAAVGLIRATMDSAQQGQRELAASTRLGERLVATVDRLAPRPGASLEAGQDPPAELALRVLLEAAGNLASEDGRASARQQLAALVGSVRRPRHAAAAERSLPSLPEAGAAPAPPPTTVAPSNLGHPGRHRPGCPLTVTLSWMAAPLLLLPAAATLLLLLALVAHHHV